MYYPILYTSNIYYKDHLLKERFVFYQLIFNRRVFIFVIHVFFKDVLHYSHSYKSLSWLPWERFRVFKTYKADQEWKRAISYTIDFALFNGKLSFLYFRVRTLLINGWPLAGHAHIVPKNQYNSRFNHTTFYNKLSIQFSLPLFIAIDSCCIWRILKKIPYEFIP